MSIAAMPIGGNNLNRYLIPHPLPALTGGSLFAPATNFTPRDGFWSREFNRIILIAASNSGVYNYDGVRNTVTLHQQAGLVAGDTGELNGEGDRIAGVRANNLTVLAYDRTTGLLAADVTLTDSVNFSFAMDCSWDPTGEYIVVANNPVSGPVISIVRYVRSPASLTIVATFNGVFGEGREGISWGANDIIFAGGLQLGFWALRFDRSTNTLTRFGNVPGTFNHDSVEASPTGEWVAGFDHVTFVRAHIFRYTPAPDTLTLQNSLQLPLNWGGLSPPNGKISWDSNSRNILLNSSGATGAPNVGVLRLDPVGLGATPYGHFFHSTSIGALKCAVNNIHHVIAVIRESSAAPIEIRPWASNINI